jgi:hypothetical protein
VRAGHFPLEDVELHMRCSLLKLTVVMLALGGSNSLALAQVDAPKELDPAIGANQIPGGYGFATAKDPVEAPRRENRDPSWITREPGSKLPAARSGVSYNYATDTITRRLYASAGASQDAPPIPPEFQNQNPPLGNRNPGNAPNVANPFPSVPEPPPQYPPVPPANNQYTPPANNQYANPNAQSNQGATAPSTTGGCAACGDCASGSCACASGNCNSCDCNSGCGCCFPLIHIDDPCPLTCEDAEVCRVFDDCCSLKCYNTTLTGWVDGGIMGNSRDTADRFNGPLTFPDRNGEGQLNQLWLSLDRSAPKDNCGWYLGGHVDYFYGSDYFFTTAAGLDGTRDGNVPRWDNNNFLYGSAMPQLYVEATLDTDFKLKFGHFFTIIGYEVVPAIGNFFYSHAYTMQYGEPFTHTGIMASKTNEDWTYYAGITNGWDTFSADSRANFLGGVTYTDKDWGSLAFAITVGDNPTSGGPGVPPFADRTMYSIVWSRTLTSRLTYVLQHDYGIQDDLGQSGNSADWYGINQYAFYKLNCCWSAGMRVEWFRDDDGARVTGLRPGNAIAGASFPGNFYELTLGLNYKPNGNFAIRPEVRWDWYEGLNNQNQAVAASLPYDAGTRSNQFTFGLDLIYQF